MKVLKIKNSIFNTDIENEAADINVIVKDSKDIFEHFGFRSLEDKVMNAGLETYIINSIKSYPLKKKVNIIISFMQEIEQVDITSIEKIIHTHFMYKAEETDLNLKQQFRQWKINMSIGVLFLVLCLILVEILERFSSTNIVKIIKESLLIIGWVALWEPITFILFGWRSVKRNKLYYEKLSHIAIVKEKLQQSKKNFK
jgi:hypothetical protein